MKYQNLFTPVKIGSVTIKNRFALGVSQAQGTHGPG